MGSDRSDEAMRASAGPSRAVRARREEQRQILTAALDALGSGGAACAFDLDSTLLDNRGRQARIIREFGAQCGDGRLAGCTAAEVVSWALSDSCRLLGLTAAEAEAMLPALRAFWEPRFFTSPYCAEDVAMPGARDFLEAVLRRGGRVVYVTGRPVAMEAGTLDCFRREGFPLPAGAGATWPATVELWMLPAPFQSDDAWKAECYRRLQRVGGIAAAFDNEPTHVNGYKERFPAARVVHLDTDHSGRPVAVRDDIPSVLDFRLELP